MILYILKKYANRIKKNNLWQIKKFSFSDIIAFFIPFPIFIL